MLNSIEKCACGAVGLKVNNENNAITMSKQTYDKNFSFLGDRCDYELHNCNHCINNWGIDIDPEHPQDEDGDTIIIEPDTHIISEIKKSL